MKKLLKMLLIATMIISIMLPATATYAASGGNDYPVVLCHGNGGWGRNEFDVRGYYWGGSFDLETSLNNDGYEVYSAAVGPFSSNWDRACELYAYILGGTVDYGKAHSDKFDHDRYGRTYPGLYPQWGEVEQGEINKIHLLGHSQGGQTTRLMVQLLEEGMQSEIEAVLGSSPTQEQIDAAVESGRLSKLFTGTCNDWVASVSTFATPHDGTTLADSVNLVGGDVLGLFVAQLGGITGVTNNTKYNLDLKLDQWSLQQKPGELYSLYFLRVMGSSMWKTTKDFSNYDLSTKGAAEMNAWVKDQPNVYYFSYSCQATKKALLGYNQLPDTRYMNPLFYGPTMIMGAYLNPTTGIGTSWLPNDGIVNTISEDGPSLGRSFGNIVAYNGTPQIGKWNNLGVLTRTDHEDILGRSTSNEMIDVKDFYSNHFDMLKGL